MADETQVRRIRSGVDSWNRWREGYEDAEEYPLIDLTGANLSGLDLERVNLAGADLTRANLSRANLTGADLDAATLANADLSEVIASGVCLSEADCCNAKFVGGCLAGADCDGTDFSDANLRDANLEGANLFEAIFDQANLLNANLSRVNATWCSFESANLIGSYLWDGRFHYASFSKACLPGRTVLIKGSRIRFEAENDEMDNDSTNDEPVLPRDGADFSGANFSDARLTGLDFGDSVLSGSVLAWCDLRSADMRRVHFLSSASLVGSDLSGAQLPPGISFAHQFDHASDLVKSSRMAHSILLTFGAYAVTAVWLADRSADKLFDLQLIGLRVSENKFMLASSLIIAVFFFHFQVLLQRIWELMSEMPTIFPDGHTLPNKMPSWWLTEFAWRHLKVIREFERLEPPKHYTSQYLSIVLLSWVVFPACLASFGAYMILSKAPMWMTGFVITIASISILFSIYSYVVVATLAAWRHRDQTSTRNGSAWRTAISGKNEMWGAIRTRFQPLGLRPIWRWRRRR
jgi:uncharacterized protein YjbI with pentapeptide repeats